MRILNCTNHNVTEKQIRMGIIEPDSEDKMKLQASITFDLPFSMEDIDAACTNVVTLTKKYDCTAAMIGGAPFLQGYLEQALFSEDLCAAFAFSRRRSEEKRFSDGTIKKIAFFDTSNTIIKEPNANFYIINAD